MLEQNNSFLILNNLSFSPYTSPLRQKVFNAGENFQGCPSKIKTKIMSAKITSKIKIAKLNSAKNLSKRKIAKLNSAKLYKQLKKNKKRPNFNVT